ncbi:MAG: hypothetical protein M1569_01200 [Candidatus Marsarchaeota archaeon]|nr:hypothetical protein [Candidatus Marsarchaeota archaeon]MCL5413005.1 hypothetical protein [Candidatus Marsarchaeota archaeon]
MGLTKAAIFSLLMLFSALFSNLLYASAASPFSTSANPCSFSPSPSSPNFQSGICSCPLFTQQIYQQPSGFGGFGNILLSDFSISLIALTLSFDTIAIAFMLSKIFTHQGIRNWLQNEYFEVIKSALIIAGIFLLLIFLSNIAYLISPSYSQFIPSTLSGYPGNIAGLTLGSESYLCLVSTNLNTVFTVFGNMASGVAIANSFNLGFYIPIPLKYVTILSGITWKPFGNLMIQTGNFIIGPYGSLLNDMVNFVLFPVDDIVDISILMLPSIVQLGLVVLIPIGILFRAFPFVRGIGGTLIAMGIGLALLWPSLLLLFNYPITNLVTSVFPVQPIDLHVPSTTSSTNVAGLIEHAVNKATGSPSSSISSIILGSSSKLQTCPSLSNLISISAILNPGKTIAQFAESIACNTFEVFSGTINVMLTTAFTTAFNPIINAASAIQNGLVNLGETLVYFVETLFPGNIYPYLSDMISYGVYPIIQLLLFLFDLIILYSLTDSIAKSLGGTIRVQLGNKLRLG